MTDAQPTQMEQRMELIDTSLKTFERIGFIFFVADNREVEFVWDREHMQRVGTRRAG